MLRFAADDFRSLFGAYNAAIWPAQIIAYGLAACGLSAVALRSRRGWAFLFVALAAMWLFTGVAYHLIFFATINPIAKAFAALFAIEACILLAFAKSAGVETASRGQRICGGAMIAYAALIYPALGLWLDGYPDVPLFGVTPCPVTIFTIGTLLLEKRPPWQPLVIPVVWSLVGGSAAFLLGIVQDWVLLASGPLAVGLMVTARLAHPKRV